MTLHRRTAISLIATAALSLFLGCRLSAFGIRTVQVGPLRSESTTIGPQGAELVRVTVRIGAGELTVRRGDVALLDAEFTYNVDEWEPEVVYEVTNGQGRLTLRQPDVDRISLTGRTRYRWDLRFGDAIPLDMRIEAGAGNHEMNLSGLPITDLNVTLGAGDARVDLSNNPTLSRLDLSIGAGSVAVDLSGPQDRNAQVEIRGGVGSTTVRLPEDIGVRVDVTRGIGDLEMIGLRREGNVWVNQAYGESEVTMEVRIRAGVGRIALEARD